MSALHSITELEQQVRNAQEKRADLFFQLGMAYSVGRDTDLDTVAAHKWFNLAAMNGCLDAIAHRRELAEIMSEEEVVEALRQAREYIKTH